MSFKEAISGLIPALNRRVVKVLASSFLGEEENKVKLPVFPEWFFSARLGQPRQTNLNEIRTFAKSPWVQIAINTIKKEVKQIPYEIVLADENSKEDIADYKTDIEKINDFLLNINTNNETIDDLMSAIITDLGEIDSGVWTKVYSADSYSIENVEVIDEMGRNMGTEPRLVLKPFGKRELLQLWYADGATFLFYIDIFRRIQGYYQYTFKNPRTTPIFFDKNEIVYFMMNKRSYTLYGFSPTQAAQQEIELMMQSTRYNKDFFTKNMIPDAIVFAKEAGADSLEQFKDDWAENVQGKPHKLLFMGTDGKVEILNMMNKDMEWLEGQKWYFHIIFGQFGMSPAEVGFYEGSNRSCYSDDTEVLTDKGWKNHSNWKTGEKIAVFDKDSSELKFEHPKYYKTYNVKEKLINIKNKRNDILVTDNHTILYKERRHNNWEISKASKLKYDRMKLPIAPEEFLGDYIDNFILPKIIPPDTSYRRYQHNKPKYRYEQKVINMNDWLEFLGWYLSEGGLSSTSSGYLITFAQKDKSKIENIEILFKKLKKQGIINYSSYLDKKDGCQRWNVYGKQLWIYLKNNCGDYSHNKKVPNWIFNLCKEQQRIIFDSMMLGDGHIRDNYGYSLKLTSKQLVDDFGRIALILGYGTSYSIGRKKKKPHHHDMFNLNIIIKKFAQIQSSDISHVDYEGIVWCFQTSTGFFVTRRNGKVAIQGNTQEGQERVTVKNAIKPYLDLFEKKLNSEVIPELLQQEKPKIKFKFFPEDHAAESIQFDHDMKEIEMGTMTPNEYRKTRGRNDIEGGDEIRQTNQSITFEGQNNSPDAPKPGKPNDKDKKKFISDFGKHMRDKDVSI